MRYDQPARNRLELAGRLVSDILVYYWPLAALTVWAHLENSLQGAPYIDLSTLGAAFVAIVGTGRTAYAGFQHYRDWLNERQEKYLRRQGRLADDLTEQETDQETYRLLQEYLREKEVDERRKVGVPPFLARRAGQRTGSYLRTENPSNESDLPPFMEKKS